MKYYVNIWIVLTTFLVNLVLYFTSQTTLEKMDDNGRVLNLSHFIHSLNATYGQCGPSACILLENQWGDWVHAINNWKATGQARRGQCGNKRGFFFLKATGNIGMALVPSLFLPSSGYLDEIHSGNELLWKGQHHLLIWLKSTLKQIHPETLRINSGRILVWGFGRWNCLDAVS